MAPADPAAMVSVADTARTEGRFQEALELYQTVMINAPKSTGAQFGTAECLLALGKPAEAKRIFAALATDPQLHAVALQGSGLADLALNEREHAAAELREAAAADPKLWRAQNGLGMLADLQHQPKEALAYYDKALETMPDSAMVLNNRGYSQLLAGQPDKAIDDLRRALALNPSSETVLNNLRIAMAAKGRYREATARVPKESLPVVMNNVGYMAMVRGDLAEAETYLSRALAESPKYETTAAENMQQLLALKGGK
jgi:Flp pilus assembly protein TadD